MWLTTQSALRAHIFRQAHMCANHGRPHKFISAHSSRDPVRDDVPSTAAACSFPAPRDVKETLVCVRVCVTERALLWL